MTGARLAEIVTQFGQRSILAVGDPMVEFVRYPAETSHGMSRNGPPSLRLDRLKRNLSWLDCWLKPEKT